MTAIFYPDCEANSPNGKHRLEARSPHNGTINHKDGRLPTDDEYGFNYHDHQSEFRYRLLEIAGQDQRVLWERWQPRGEDSPHELLVSNDGWSIIRTHGFRPEIIAVAPSGKDCVHVRLTARNNREADNDSAEFCWLPRYIVDSTAGLFWSSFSWPYFFRIDDRKYFAWRASWGQRLVIDLEHARLLSDEDQASSPLSEQLIDVEKRSVHKLLSTLSEQWVAVRRRLNLRRSDNPDRHPLDEQIRYAGAALHLTGLHKMKGCISFLREWEVPDVPSLSTGTVTIPNGWLEVQYYRPIVHHSLRLLDHEPKGFAPFNFRVSDTRLPIPEQILDRQSRKGKLDRSMFARDVLGIFGSPDHVRRRSRKEGKFYKWYEGWDYDFRHPTGWTTLRITWEEANGNGRIIAIKESPATWVNTDEREAEILRDLHL
jgi:hypothetical protein